MDFPPLDKECEACKGQGEVKGVRYDFRHFEKCYDCDGHGRTPTEFGEAVLQFVIGRLKFKTSGEV